MAVISTVPANTWPNSLTPYIRANRIYAVDFYVRETSVKNKKVLSSHTVSGIEVITQAQYDELSEIDNETLYLIK